MRNLLGKILDKYFHIPMFWDFILSIILILSFQIIRWKFDLLIINMTETIASDLLSSLVNITVTIGGFLLTILTIVVTFKNTVDEKRIISGDTKNEKKDTKLVSTESKLEVFFSSNLYFKSVKLITQGIFEYGLLFLLLIFVQINIIPISIHLKSMILISCVLCLSLVFLRCIFVLSQIIQLQKRNSDLLNPESTK